jgi:hypothetical protein
MASIIVSRKHVSGNITSGLFLVDLACLGIKETFSYFNMPLSEFNNLENQMNERLDLTEVPYTLVHNIIFTALEFADDLGFAPDPEFWQTTQYLLEEDDDKIELIEIECGINGKPAYIKSPAHTPKDVSRIISVLDKNVGKGNYIIEDVDFV